MQKKSVFKNGLRRVLLLFVGILLVLGAVACKEEVVTYTTGVEQVSGGNETEAQSMSVSDIDINYFQAQSEIALHFVYSDYEETQGEIDMITLPQYDVYLLDEPYRLAITLYNIDTVNYVQKNTWGLGEHISGLFRSRVKDSDVTTIYFELTEPVQFLVDEGDNTLRILLEDGDAKSSESHFIMVNAFDEFLSGELGEDLGLTPVLCADKVNIAMISEPYANSDAAEAARINLETELRTQGILKIPYTMTLAGETMPVMNTDIDPMDPEENGAAYIDGRVVDLPVKLDEARLIAQNSSADIYIKQEESADGSFLLDGEMLWMVVNASGVLTDLGLPAFTSIQQAAFSYDERYLGFIDVNVETQVLYVYDFQSGKLFNLGEEDFGVNTVSFCWAEDEDAVYAVTGNENMRIAKCQFTDASLILTTIIPSVTGQGKLADNGDTLLLANSAAGEHGIIYAYDKKSGEKTFLCEGVDFALAPDKETMAVVEYIDYGEETGYGNFKLYSFLDKSETVVVAGGIVESFAFLPSSTALIFTDGSESDETYRYNYVLMTYDMGTSTSTRIGYLKSGGFILSSDAKLLNLMGRYLGSDGRYHYTTYGVNWRDY